MLCGVRAFAGATAPEAMAAVLRDPVRWERLPPETPAAVRRVLDRCLRRDRRERLQAIGDARLELAELPAGEGAGEAGGEAAPARRRAALPWAVAGLAALGALALALARPGAGPERPRMSQLSLDLPAGLSVAGSYASPFAVSPDGSRLAIAVLKEGSRRLVVRRLDRTEVLELEGTEGAWQPAFSPDGRELAFFADRKLKKVPAAGGPVATLAEIGANPRGLSWAPDGTLVFCPSYVSGLWRVPPGGGPPEQLTAPSLEAGESSHRWPQVLPGGRWILFTTGYDDASFDDARLEVLSPATGERRVLLEGATQGRYAGGYLFHARAGQLLAAPFDPAEAVLRGAPALVVEDVRYDPRNGGAHYALSDGGVLVYGPGRPGPPEHHLAWVDAAGRLSRIGGPPRRFRGPRLSPDGRRIAVVVGPASDADLWIADAGSGALDRASWGLSPHRPAWTPDGRGITVGARAAGRWRLLTLPAAGAGAGVAVLESDHQVYPDAWTPDGRALVFEERRPGTGWDVRRVEVGSDGRASGAPRDLLATPFDERNAALSADGRLLAFESNELDGVNGIYVASLATPGAKVRATPTFANWARWGAGHGLYYWYPAQVRPGDSGDAEGLYRLDWRVAAAGLASQGPVPAWPRTPPGPGAFDRIVLGPYAPFDVDASGPGVRFLVLETSAARLAPALASPVVVLGWQELLPGAGAGRR
jgi:serine/threonine-protein kinase